MMNYPKVKVIRAGKREGLIRARLLGAAAAKAPVLTYLDSHCECTEGWLEPLLDRIARDPTTVVCPVIDVIDDTTLEYHWRDSGGVNVGGFDWNLQVNEIFALGCCAIHEILDVPSKLFSSTRQRLYIIVRCIRVCMYMFFFFFLFSNFSDVPVS